MNCPNCNTKLIEESIIDNEKQLLCPSCNNYMTAWKICECGADVVYGECVEACGRLSWSWKLINEI